MEKRGFHYQIHKAVSERGRIDPNLVVLFLLEGKLTLCCQNEVYDMESRDIILINPGVSYEIRSSRDALCGAAEYSLPAMTSMLDGRQMFFYANSVSDGAHSYQDLRSVFLELTAVYAANDRQTACLTDSLLLKLFDCLVERYQMKRQDAAEGNEAGDVRMREIMQYIMANLGEDLSLNELAERMYLSSSTLSRIFKKNTGVYFADYVMQLRVQSSLGLLTHSEQTITQIAMTCGFVSSATYTRAFRKVMEMTPSDYREHHRWAAAKEARVRREEEAAVRRELIEKGWQTIHSGIEAKVSLDLRETRELPVQKKWNRMINIGPIWDLTKANVQFHALYLQEHLGFRYIRLWNVFSKKMLMTDGRTIGQYNYDAVDQVLDFLVQNKLKPFLELGRRPDTALRSYGKEVFYEEQYITFVSRESWERQVDDFLIHLVDRYGSEEVSEWIFELAHDFFHPGETVYQDEKSDFFEAYRYLCRAVRRHLPGAKVGGIGGDVMVGKDYLTRFFRRCVENDVKPDFVSFVLFPYDSRETADGGYENKLSRDEDFEMNRVSQMRRLMEQTGLAESELYITEWNNSISNRNFLNDSCFRAAYLIKRLTGFAGMADLIGIMSGTDWVSSYMDTTGIANGGIGLLTRDTIRKPAYYALDFFNQTGNRFLAGGTNYIVTRRENGDFYILCFYYSPLRRSYYLQDEAMDIKEYKTSLFEDDRPLSLEISLKNMDEVGEYCLKRRTLNGSNGSLLEEWEKFQFDTRLNRDDVKYIGAVCIPSLSLTRTAITAENRTLELKIVMQPQEITLIHIFRRK